MAIEKQRAAEPVQEKRKLVVDRGMIGTMDLVDSRTELRVRDRAAPQMSMLLRTSGNDPETAARPSGDAGPACSLDHGRVDLILGAVAVDGCARRSGDHRPGAAADSAPGEPVDERIF
jgi:hypothetical protein